jgi:hypothetical protein
MPPTRSLSLATILLAAAILALTVARTPASAQDTGWTITSFDVAYDIRQDGTVLATERIEVDFAELERHGIFRDIPVEYYFDPDNNRLIELTDISVTDGTQPIDWRIDSERPNLRIRIGDPDVFVTGQQTYVISYTINDGLNPFEAHDEFYWNVTGNDWPVTVLAASATVSAPGGIFRVTCYQGPTGSTEPCDSSSSPDQASFQATRYLAPGSGLTLVTALESGAVDVDDPILVPSSEDVGEQFVNFMGLDGAPLGIAAGILVLGLIVIYRLWWTAGRDRWYGNTAHRVEGAIPEDVKPWGAHETIVVEYSPPTVPSNGRDPERHLHPAEIGILIDEQADTLDVSATIVDLAVRRHLKIIELEKGGILGIFKKQDYELQRLENPEDSLLPYEERLYDSLFEGKDSVKLSDLRNKFHEDLAKVKKDLYDSSVKQLKIFPRNPETVRTIYQVAGGITLAIGVALVWLLGEQFDAGVIGVPLIILGAILLIVANAMPRRTGTGRQLYRRALGFRLYMETAETDRQRFAENQNIFHEYLPYAIVYQCVDKWAEVFEDLGLQPQADYYVGHRAFVPLSFANTMSSFSASISTAMASTPGGSGGSGFGGGGGSGGGGGGGGGGSW